MTSQPSLLHFFNKKTAVPEPNSDDIPCSSNIINNTEIESNTDTTNLTEMYDIGLYINTRISDDKLKYDLLKKPWQPHTLYNFPVGSLKKKIKISTILDYSFFLVSIFKKTRRCVL